MFLAEPIKFRTTTALALSRLARPARMKKLGDIAAGNAAALTDAIRACARLGIGAFRVVSSPFPRATHPEVGYALSDLPGWRDVRERLEEAARIARQLDIRLSFHPDQYVVLNSPRADVVDKSLAELEHHAEMAAILGADVINIHGGGAYGDKPGALAAFATGFARLSRECQARLSLENDDVTYAPVDLLPLCRAIGVPFVYDVHHHRCLPDGMSVRQATEACAETWRAAGREPYMHISSPRDGWDGNDPKPHHDYVNAADFPAEWLDGGFTVDVEARAKEAAVLQLKDAVEQARRKSR